MLKLTESQNRRLIKSQIKGVGAALQDPDKVQKASQIACEVALRAGDTRQLADYVETEVSSPINLLNAYVRLLDDETRLKVAVRGPTALADHITGKNRMSDVEPFDLSRNYLVEALEQSEKIRLDAMKALREFQAEDEVFEIPTPSKDDGFFDMSDDAVDVEPNADGYFSPLSMH